MPIRVITFDADDTLWINETYFREAEEKFASLLEDFLPQHAIMKELYRTEIANLIQRMSAEIEELRRTKVNVTRIVPNQQPVGFFEESA